MRNEFSRKTRSQAWARANGRCEGLVPAPAGIHGISRCTAPLDLGGFHYDHIIPDWINGPGSNTLENCQVLCLECHAKKTARDQGAIAKSKRIQDRRIKALTTRHPLPFGKGSRLKKKIDGRIVERD